MQGALPVCRRERVNVLIELGINPGQLEATRGAVTCSAVSRCLARLPCSLARPSNTPQNDGTYFGSSPPLGSRLQKTPAVVPVFSSVPRPVLVWSPRKQPTFVRPVSTRRAAHGHRHLAVVVAQVAVVRAGAEVDPFADVGVAEEAVVILVRVALHDARLDLAADRGSAGRARCRPAPSPRAPACRGPT